MAQAVRDQNQIPVLQGVSDSDQTTPLNVTIDSLTNRVTIVITSVADNVGTLPAQPAQRDGNFVPVAMGVSDADGVTPLPILMDSRNNLIYCDVLAE